MRNGSAARNTFSSFAAPAAAWLLAWQTAGAQVSVTTYHNDNSRTGQNTHETVLNPANVNSDQFGKLFTVAVDGYVFAQPLYLCGRCDRRRHAQRIVRRHGTRQRLCDRCRLGHRVLARQSDPAGRPDGRADTDIAAGCDDIVPEIGITGTPVIDPVDRHPLRRREVLRRRLGAFNICMRSTAPRAAEKFGGPVRIEASVPGSGYDAKNSVVDLQSACRKISAPRCCWKTATSSSPGVRIATSTPWHGWLMSYGASTLAQEAVSTPRRTAYKGGIWMSGGGVAADTSGNLVFLAPATATGTVRRDFGDSVIKLGPPSGGAFPLLDYFTPVQSS